MKTGAVADNSVALAMLVYLTAPKKKAKCNPRKTPEMLVRILFFLLNLPCGLAELKDQRIILAMNILQSPMIIGERSGIKRAKIEAVLIASKAVASNRYILNPDISKTRWFLCSSLTNPLMISLKLNRVFLKRKVVERWLNKSLIFKPGINRIPIVRVMDKHKNRKKNKNARIPLVIMLPLIMITALSTATAEVDRPVNSHSQNKLIFEGEKHFKNIRQLTFSGENAEAYFSADGKHLILQGHDG